MTQNMHSQPPVASQHKKTNKVVWTCEDDWPPKRTSTYERPFTREGNYLVHFIIEFEVESKISVTVSWLEENLLDDFKTDFSGIAVTEENCLTYMGDLFLFCSKSNNFIINNMIF